MQKEPYQHPISFPPDLPIVAHLQEIQAALEKHQVIVVAGETGSGKTTQLPKLMLALGRGTKGLIGHTQPRRIAARSVAQRIAEELKVSLGQTVGFQVRFSQHLSDQTYLKLMTDGIFLAELAQDRLLKRYDTLIIDEAHERSLNIDFILGYLKWLLPKRPDLKVIITSATLDHQRFSEHFYQCPVIEVSGRSYPVEICYQTLMDHDSQDLAQMKGILAAIQSFNTEGDILVFLSGEREIRQTTDFLKKSGLRHTEILPLFSKLSAQEQQKIFHPNGMRRVILSTNVAETSLTIPNIYYVIDTGLARIKRYSYRSKIQRLPIEPISKASAKQRAGRCGRIAPGTCVRLYEEADFNLREAYTQPEILRSNLANVILQMLVLRLGDPEKFPWLDPPESQYWKDAYQCLEELRAIEIQNGEWVLTDIGRGLAKLPIDPRLGRMLLTAEEKNCVQEVLIIVSALSVGDIFQRPMDQRQAADEKHRAFFYPNSDFLTYVNLWNALHEYQAHHSKNKLRQYCEENFLSYLRFREWQDMVGELMNTSPLVGEVDQAKPGRVRGMINVTPHRFDVCDVSAASPARGEASQRVIAIHQSLLSGLLGHVAMREEGQEYLATRQRYLKIFPGSACFKKPPPWIMAMEIVETKNVYARTVAAIESAWIEPLAPHLIKKTYSDPHWDVRRGEVTANEKVLFFGLPIIQKRRVCYARMDAALSHEVFLREALAQRQFNSQLAFYVHNEKFLQQLEALEESTRSRHFVPDETWLYHFYQDKIPKDICNQVDCEKWYRQARTEEKQALMLHEALLQHESIDQHQKSYPQSLEWQGNTLKLSYQFAPGSAEDGVTLEVPLLLLPSLTPEMFDWLVPGFLSEKISAILKALPKEMRQQLMPMEEAVNFCAKEIQQVAWIEARSAENPGNLSPGFSPSAQSRLPDNFFVALSTILEQQFHFPVKPEFLSQLPIPDFLKFNFKVLDKGKVIAMGRDLFTLKAECLPEEAAKTLWIEDEILTACPEDTLPKEILHAEHGVKVTKYPAWFAKEACVVVVWCDTLDIAQQMHRFGVAKFLRLACQEKFKYLRKQVFQAFKTLMPAIECALIFMTFAEDFWQIRDAESLKACFETHQNDLVENANILLPVLEKISPLPLWERSRRRSKSDSSGEGDLEISKWLTQTPWEWLERYPYYLAAQREGEAKYEAVQTRLAPLEQSFQQLVDSYLKEKGYVAVQLEETRIADDPPLCFNILQSLPGHLSRHYYLLEELNMSLLAPRFKPIETVSETRLQKLYLHLTSGT